MKCIDFKEIILISKWEELDESKKNELKAHASECPQCAKLLEGIIKTGELMNESVIPYKKTFNPKILAEKRRHEERLKKGRRKVLLWLIPSEILIAFGIMLFVIQPTSIFGSGNWIFSFFQSFIQMVPPVFLWSVIPLIVAGMLILPLRILEK